ncbi:hypothetical protein GCM10023194_10240 [Planotetraspora phitsanulokensis]|uniref:SnoaL-like domain-containing protein n=1 Tax=Planotetraspora phitsanulokensis TaxID=575192 RepID=A0A8J3UC79_9ACTN|nr:nuclear transport factor 2 family protein [Planotetraspora phitsanulokensis]GII40651.1 hypothetical protein Pph01_56540 [Planotetraspora phitsanulokensis]
MSVAREVTDRLLAALNDHDLDAVVKCFDPEAVYFNVGGTAEGHDQIRAYYGYLLTAYPDMHYKVQNKVTEEDTTVTEWRLTATHRGPLLAPDGETIEPTHRRILLQGCSVSTVEDGMIVSYRVYFNELVHYAQLGLFLRSSDAA